MSLKRTFDVLTSGVALLVLAPLFGLIALAIKISSPGPLFYVAPRAGRGKTLFGQLKFRTMHLHADRAGAFTAKNDTRIFAVGKILRMLKVDELPQLLNVLKGEMSIVGPRPEDWETVATCYTQEQLRVLEATPGLTGLPQVRFFPDLSIIDTGGMDPQEHYRKIILPMRLAMDLEYIEKQSFLYDLGLIFRTAYLIAFRAPWILVTGRMPRVEIPA
ncbi:sugar transferase [Bryobacter aggregatus]|uniref:sugar transferase n=1 Tax=Bryobacter aggregatus TaxID=360054 RepID=UPI0006892DBE|nr:sugar transferase [Bryobacter aggregatus]